LAGHPGLLSSVRASLRRAAVRRWSGRTRLRSPCGSASRRIVRAHDAPHRPPARWSSSGTAATQHRRRLVSTKKSAVATLPGIAPISAYADEALFELLGIDAFSGRATPTDRDYGFGQLHLWSRDVARRRAVPRRRELRRPAVVSERSFGLPEAAGYCDLWWVA